MAKNTLPLYRGTKGVFFVWRGCWNDPLLRFEGKTFNYWDIEEALWDFFLEETGYKACEASNEEVETEFSAYVQTHCKDYLRDCIAGGYFA